MKHLFFSLLFFITSASFAQDPDKTVTLKASGSGTTQEQAKNNALRSAVEQAYGAFISSKTEILNDQVVADEIVSVASGNIQAFKILEEQHTDSLDFCLLEAVVSISKLTSFAQSKGFAVEVQGGMFAINIKQKQLNESAEAVAIENALTTALELMQKGFNFKISTSEPIVNDALKNDWKVSVTVSSHTNRNYSDANNIIYSLMNSISMSEDEVNEYRNLGKKVYQINYHLPEIDKTYYLRSHEGIWAFIRFCYKLPIISQRFQISDGINYYRDGVLADYYDNTIVTFQNAVKSMIEQYSKSNYSSLNPSFFNGDLAQLSENEVKWYKELFKNDDYLKYYPLLCVDKFDYFILEEDEQFSTSSFNQVYSLEQIEKLEKIDCKPMDPTATKLNLGLRPLIQMNKAVLDDKVTIQAIEKRPFQFSASINEFKDINANTIFKNNIFNDTIKVNLIPDANGIQSSLCDQGLLPSKELSNAFFVPNYLESHQKELSASSFREGFYFLDIAYIAEVDGTTSFLGITACKFCAKSKLLSERLWRNYNDSWDWYHSIGYEFYKISGRLIDSNISNIEPQNRPFVLKEGELTYLQSWISDQLSKIKNHPIGIYKSEKCSLIKARKFISRRYTLYFN